MQCIKNNKNRISIVLWVFQAVEHQIIFPSEPSASKFQASIHLMSPFISEMKGTCIGINQTHTEYVNTCVWVCFKILYLLLRMIFDGKKINQISILIHE